MKKKKKKASFSLAGFIMLTLLLLGSFMAFMAYGDRIIDYFKPKTPDYKAFGVAVPSGYQLAGIDVSRYQHKIDWEKVKKMKSGPYGINFAFAKATEGLSLTDIHYKRNREQCKKEGIPFGAYHFFRPTKDPIKQADFFCAHYMPEKGNLPPVCDIEKAENLTKEEIQAKLHQFLNRVEEKTGVKPIIYTYYSFYKSYLAGSFEDYPLWIAHYGPGKPKGTDWKFWQFTEKGHVSGIKGNVDLNVFSGTEIEFQQILVK